MLKRAITIIIVIVAFCIAGIAILYAISDTPIKYSQNFMRQFRKDIIQEQAQLDLKGNTFYLAGVTRNGVFIGDKANPFHLLITDSLLANKRNLMLSIGNENNLELQDAFIEVDSPFYYIKDGKLPIIFRGHLNFPHEIDSLDHSVYFEQAVSISKNSFAIQSIASIEGRRSTQNILGKISISSPFPELKPDNLESQMDSFYSTMGMLRYSKELRQLVYTYFYRNEYLCMDTNLNLLNRANTIDPVSRAQIKPVELNEGKYTLASPPAVVNNYSQVHGKWLFVHSNLMAANEDKEEFDSASVIDVYNISTKQYCGSFYIPDRENLSMKTFKVFDKRLVAIFDNYIVAYSLKTHLFSKSFIVRLEN